MPCKVAAAFCGLGFYLLKKRLYAAGVASAGAGRGYPHPLSCRGYIAGVVGTRYALGIVSYSCNSAGIFE